MKRILKDNCYSSEEFQNVSSFFRDSWVEVPDRISDSRFMRPQYVSGKLETTNTGNDQLGEKYVDNGEAQHDGNAGKHSWKVRDSDQPGYPDDPEIQECTTEAPQGARSDSEAKKKETEETVKRHITSSALYVRYHPALSAFF